MAARPAEDKAAAFRRRIFEAKEANPGHLYTNAEWLDLVGADGLIHLEPNPFDPGPSAEEMEAQNDMDLCRQAYQVADDLVGRAHLRVTALRDSRDRGEKNEADAEYRTASEDRDRASDEYRKAASTYTSLRRARSEQVGKAQYLAGLPPAQKDSEVATQDRKSFLEGLIGRGERSALASIANQVKAAIGQ